MKRRLALQAVVALVLALGVAVVADALVITDEERIGAFVDRVTSDDPYERIDGVLANVDPNRVPVEVVEGDRVSVYADGDDAALADHLGDVLTPLEEGTRLLQRSESLDGDRATVALRFAGDPEIDLDLRFERRGDGWLLRRIRVRD